MSLRWRLQTFLAVLPILAIPLWFYAEASRPTDRHRGEAIQRVASYAGMEKAYRDQAARHGEEAAACQERARTGQSPEETATWSERADRHSSEARQALEIAERYARSRVVEKSAWRLP